jgi:hypothetical protein
MVHENRDTTQGQTVPINVYVFPSFDPNPPSTPFLDYNGGPGIPNEYLLSAYAEGGFSAKFRVVRNILIVDQRGTGASEIICSAYQSLTPSAYSLLFDQNRVSNCLEETRNQGR